MRRRQAKPQATASLKYLCKLLTLDLINNVEPHSYYISCTVWKQQTFLNLESVISICVGIPSPQLVFLCVSTSQDLGNFYKSIIIIIYPLVFGKRTSTYLSKHITRLLLFSSYNYYTHDYTNVNSCFLSSSPPPKRPRSCLPLLCSLINKCR